MEKISGMKKQKLKYRLKNGLKNFLRQRENMIKGIVVMAIIGAFLAVLVINFSQPSYKQPEIENIAPAEIPKLETPVLDTSGWKTYRNDWYGFELKYPEIWDKPLSRNAAKGSKWEYRYEFRRKEAGEKNVPSGFDVVIYSVGKIKELSSTDEFPSFKYEMNENEICRFITGHMEGKENFSAEEILISPSDKCHNPAFFYSLTRDEYVYNVIAVSQENQGIKTYSKEDMIASFPEFFSAVSSFELIAIKRKNPPAAKPKPKAPLPVAAKVVNGRLVCAKKNDHPGESKQNKGKHLDMECCLDPDEYPNPHCYYDPKKYGKYL